jgi:hypothetical protein
MLMRDDQGMPDPTTAELRRSKFARRLPNSLAELAGPDHGTFELPLHLAWSGLRSFDLDKPRLRMSLYRIVLAEGLHEDLAHYLNRKVLITSWPILRTLVSRAVRDVWEGAFAELAAAGRTAV